MGPHLVSTTFTLEIVGSRLVLIHWGTIRQMGSAEKQANESAPIPDVLLYLNGNVVLMLITSFHWTTF